MRENSNKDGNLTVQIEFTTDEAEQVRQIFRAFKVEIINRIIVTGGCDHVVAEIDWDNLYLKFHDATFQPEQQPNP